MIKCPSPLIVSWLVLVAFSLAPTHGAANWVSVGPEGGAATALLVDAADPERILLASRAAGLFESTNGALSFQPLTDTPRQPTAFGDPIRISLFAQSPAASSFVLAAAAFREDRIWRSVDSGRTWTPVESLNVAGDIGAGEIAFNRDGSRAYALAAGGLSTSIDGGATWSPLSVSGAPANFLRFGTRIATSPIDPDRVYLFSSTAILSSDDGGASWQPLGAVPGGQISEFAVGTDVSETLYAFAVIDDGEVYASLDNGMTWTPLGAGLVDPGGDPAELTDLVVQRSTGSIFAVSEGRLHRTGGTGQPWSSSTLPASLDFPTGLEFDDTNPSRLFLLASSGLFVSTDSGSAWRQVADGYRARSVRLTPNRAAPGTIYADDDTTVFATGDNGASWTDVGPSTLFDDFAFAIVASASDPLTLDAVGFSTPIRSNDGGATWSALASPSPFVLGITNLVWSDPRDDSTLLSGLFTRDFGGLFRSTDAGSSWSQVVSPAPESLTFQPHSQTDDPTRPGTVFVGVFQRTESQPLFTDGILLRSTDGGATFDSVIDGFAFPEVAVDQAGTVFIGGFRDSIRRGIWRSTDGGDNWAAVNNGLSLSEGIVDIAVHPVTPGLVAVSTSTGLFVSSDSGASWQPISRAGLGRGNRIQSVEILSGPSSALEMMVGTDRSVFYTEAARAAGSISVPSLGPVSIGLLAILTLLLGLVATGMFTRSKVML